MINKQLILASFCFILLCRETANIYSQPGQSQSVQQGGLLVNDDFLVLLLIIQNQKYENRPPFIHS